MTNTQKYYETLKEWRAGMRQLEAVYQEKLKEWEPYKGSEGYKQAIAELDKVRADGVEQARKEYGGRFKEILSSMGQAYSGKPMKAPTQDQINLLQVLKLRGSASADEIRRAANAMKDCPAALEALRDIARGLGVVSSIPHEITGSTMAENLQTLERRTGKMLGMKKVDDRRANANGYLSDSYDLFQIDTDPKDEADCMRIMGLVTDFNGFSEMVNAAESTV